MEIINFDYLKEKITPRLFEKNYYVRIKNTIPPYPPSGFGHVFEFSCDSQDLTGGIDFWTYGQIEIGLWSRKKNDSVFPTIFFDSYKLPEAQEKIKEFIHLLLPDFEEFN